MNCYGPGDERAAQDEELAAIDAMEDAIVPLSDEMKALRQLITRFELCYHEADKELLGEVDLVDGHQHRDGHDESHGDPEALALVECLSIYHGSFSPSSPCRWP